ncbi:MAG: thiamine phosphate synthase [Ignavibacteriaceae bacterium]
MKLIIISPPYNIDEEIELLKYLFDDGLEYFHLRKPEIDSNTLEKSLLDYLEQLPEKYHNKIILHSNYDLVQKYNLKGMHYTKNNLPIMNFNYIKHQSASFHSIDEIEKNKHPFNYVFLSPVFDSISKQNYKSSFDLTTVSNFLKNNHNRVNVIALGGIDENTILQTYELGFDGVAVLGAVWKTFAETGSIDVTIKKFNKMKELCLKSVLMF